MKKFYSHFVSKKLLIVILCFICVGRLWAQTYIPGETINGDSIWTKIKSPYILKGAVTVNGSLTIEPGVTVQFTSQENGGLYLDIKGTLTAKGTQSNPIIFQGPGADGLDGYYKQNFISGPIYIESSSNNSVLQYVTVDAMGFGYNKVSDITAAIDVTSGYCSIINCTIKNIRGTGVLFENQSFVDFSNDSLIGNRVGVKFEALSAAIANNYFVSNQNFDLITELDNLPQLSANNPLSIGLTSNLPMKAKNDTLNGYNIDYTLLAGLTVPSGLTLNVEPAAKVVFPSQENGGLFLDVKGRLNAIGTETSPIIFQGPGATGLDGYYKQNFISGPVIIESNGSATSSTLQHVLVDGMGYGYNKVDDATAAIDVKSNYGSITNCIIQNIRGTGILFEQFYNIPVTGNTLSNNRVGMKFEKQSGIVSANKITGSANLDLITELDNIGKVLQTNNPLHIGYTSNLTMSQNDTLTSYNYDYRLLAGLTVSPNKTLTIQPGVLVLFPSNENGGLFLDVKGTLIAKGAADTYITFQQFTSDGLDGYYKQNFISGPIYIDSSSINTVLQYVTVDELGYGYNKVSDATAALDISSSSCSVLNSTFQNIRGTGVAVHNASPYIAGSCFNTNRGGIYSNIGKARIFHSNFVGNTTFGVKNVSKTDTLDATECWWNNPLGPTNITTNPVGGDIVSDYVLFDPWATEQPFDCSDQTILPLTLLNFQTTLSNNTVNCSWQTATETNTSYFIIQHSTDGANFTSLGKVYAAGNSNSNKSYSFIDKSPNNGINYYRLQMADKDGRYTYSKTLPINISIKQPFAIYPNPVKNVLYVQVQRNVAEKVSLQIIDMQGKMVAQQSQQLAAGVTTLSVNTTALAKGSYFIVIKGKTTEKKLFVKE